jgi:hypothetical protein
MTPLPPCSAVAVRFLHEPLDYLRGALDALAERLREAVW